MPPVLQKTIREIHQRLRALETREYAEVVGPGSVINAQYLTLALHAVLTAERRFVDGDGLVGVDGGANADYTLNARHVLLSTSHTDTLAAAVVDGDVIIGNVTPRWSRLAIAIPAANVRNVLGIDNAELRPSWKTALDNVNPADIAGAAAPGVSLIFSHRDHVHAHPAGLGANLHHTQIHDVVGGDHTLTGAQWNLVGATALNTIGLLLPSSNPGAAAAILMSTAAGGLTLVDLTLTNDLILTDGAVVGIAGNEIITWNGGAGTIAVTGANFGVGVADPDELVELYKVGIQLKLSGGAADYATFAVAADGALTITTIDVDAALAHLLLMPDGNVGIGTATPDRARVDIRGTPALQYGFSLETDNAGRGQMILTSDYVFNTTGSVLQFGLGAGSGDTYSYIQAYDAGKSSTNTLALQRFGGNVTVGPSAIAGPVRASLMVEHATAAGIALLATVQGTIDFGDVADNDIGRIAYIHASNSMWFMTNTAIQVTIASTGRVGFKVAVPLAQVHIDQAVADAAIPVLTLDQADISEGFINFIGSDRGVITGATDSLVSVRVELAGVIYRLALYVDA